MIKTLTAFICGIAAKKWYDENVTVVKPETKKAPAVFFQDAKFHTVDEFNAAMVKLEMLLKAFGNISVADVKNLGNGGKINYTDIHWGWSSLEGFSAFRGAKSGMYYIQTPLPKKLFKEE